MSTTPSTNIIRGFFGYNTRVPEGFYSPIGVTPTLYIKDINIVLNQLVRLTTTKPFYILLLESAQTEQLLLSNGYTITNNPDTSTNSTIEYDVDTGDFTLTDNPLGENTIPT